MNNLVAYDLYKHPNGLLYRVPLCSPLRKHAEVYNKYLQQWLPVGGLISSKHSALVARNVVFKDKTCSQ